MSLEPTGRGPSTHDSVVQMGDACVSLEDPSALQLDLLGSKAFEQASALAEEHRNDVEFDSSRTPAASANCAVPAPWTSTFLSPAASLARVIAVLTSFT